jgi:hypothetical protein
MRISIHVHVSAAAAGLAWVCVHVCVYVCVLAARRSVVIDIPSRTSTEQQSLAFITRVYWR